MKCLPQCVLLCASLACLVTTARSFGNPRPPAPAAPADDLGAVTYPGLRLLRATLAADGSRVLLDLDGPSRRRHVVAVHDVATGREIFKREATGPDTVSLAGEAIAPDGKHVVVNASTAAIQFTTAVIDVDTQRTIWQSTTGPGGSAFLADGKAVLVSYLPLDGNGTRRLKVVEHASGNVISEVSTREVQVGQLLLSSDGDRLLASVDVPGPDPMCVFDLRTQKKTADLDGSTPQRLSDRFRFLAGTHDVVVGLVGGKLTRWNSTTGKVVGTVNGIEQLGRDEHAEFSPDGRRLYLRVGSDLVVRDGATGELLHRRPVARTEELMTVSNDGVVGLRLAGSLRFVRVPLKPPPQ